MTVFKGVLLHFWRYKGALLIFTGIFFAVAFAFSQTSSNDFSLSSMDIQVVDNADDDVSNGLVENLSLENNVDVVDKTRAELQEEILLMTSDAVLIIEEDLEERFLDGEATVEVIVDERVAGAFQIDNIVNKYFRYLNAEYQANGEINTAAVNETMQNTVSIDLLDVEESVEQQNFEHMRNYMNFMGYVLILMITIVGGNVMSDINQPQINNRVKVSPIKQMSHSFQTILAQTLVTSFMVLLFIVFAFVLRANHLEGVPVLNIIIASATIPLFSLSILHLLNSMTNNKFIINSIANFVIIGMAFLSGIFIPYEMLGDGMRQLASFMPLYHFTQIYSDIDGSVIDALPSVGIVVLFSVSMIILGTIISKNRLMQM